MRISQISAIAHSIAGMGGPRYVPRQRFFRICTLLLLRERNPYSDIPLVLTEKGKIDLSDVNLYADLRGIDLRGVRLFNARLTGCKLNHANLRRADLRYAKLTSADFADADMHFVKREHFPDT